MSHKLSRSQQSRINGAKSKGPVTAEGKAISSANALKHGFAAVINVVLRIEDKDAFNQHLQSLRASYKPQDYAEQCFVDELAAISWRKARLTGLETALIDAQIDLQHDQVCASTLTAANDPYYHLAQAWQALARQPKKPGEESINDSTVPPDGYDINSLHLLHRYQASLDRQFRNTLLNFNLYRKDFANQQPSPPATADPTEQVEPERIPTIAVQPTENPPQPAPIRAVIVPKPASDRPPTPNINDEA